MKTKLMITSAILILAITFFSFKKSGEKEGTTIALVSLVAGKDPGFFIMYGDGTSELKPWDIKMTSMESILKAQMQLAVVMNEMLGKGYHFTGMATFATTSLAFEKK